MQIPHLGNTIAKISLSHPLQSSWANRTPRVRENRCVATPSSFLHSLLQSSLNNHALRDSFYSHMKF